MEHGGGIMEESGSSLGALWKLSGDSLGALCRLGWPRGGHGLLEAQSAQIHFVFMHLSTRPGISCGSGEPRCHDCILFTAL